MKFSEKQKQEFFDVFLAYRGAGETFVGAYSKARADFSAAEKTPPKLWVFRRWYNARMNGEQEESAPAKEEQQANETVAKQSETAADTESAKEGSAEPETEEVPDEVLAQDEEAAQPADDYTKRLELICRMYRTHSEESRDALCDYLLPELWRDKA